MTRGRGESANRRSPPPAEGILARAILGCPNRRTPAWRRTGERVPVSSDQPIGPLECARATDGAVSTGTATD